MSLLFSMFSFSLAMSISPGPVNMIILSSGVNHGLRKTIPYVSGATIGFTLLLLVIGLVLNPFIQAYPIFLFYLSIAGALFMIYIGYKIASCNPDIVVKHSNTPKFYEGFLLQWLNPKAWIACVSGVSIFSSTESHTPFFVFLTIYFLVCYVSLSLWAVVGNRASLLLNKTTYLRFFNLTMGLLLIMTAVYLLLGAVDLWGIWQLNFFY